MVNDLTEAVFQLDTTEDQTVFSEAVRIVERIKRNIDWSDVSGAALGLISEADKIIFSRVRKKTWCLQLKGFLAFPILVVALSFAPLVHALFLAIAAWSIMGYNPFEAFAIVFLAMYSTRFAHEIGHWLFMRKIAAPVAIYGSPLFVTIRIQIRYLTEQVGLLGLARLYGGGSAANLLISIVVFLALIVINATPPLLVAVLLANVTTAIFNLVPLSKGTDGSMLLRIFSSK